MKLASFNIKDRQSYGVVVGDGVIDAGSRLGLPTLRAALDAGAETALRQMAGERVDFALKEVMLLPPITEPQKILCIGLNFHAHLIEVGFKEKLQYPMVFARFANSHVADGQAMVRPKISEQFDYEGELAVVIGKRARNIPAASANDVILGYSCYNEGTIRDWSTHTIQVIPGKSFPNSGAFGPWIVTRDEIPDPTKLTIITRLNGTVMQNATISDLVFDIPALIAYCSTFTELVPGDVICTGNSAGSGAFRKPPVWMKPGDDVEVDIASVGLLRNTVVAE